MPLTVTSAMTSACWASSGKSSCLTVVAWILLDLSFEGLGDPPDVVPGSPAVTGHEDHSVVTGAARGDRLVVQGPEVAQVVGHDGAAFSASERQHVRI